MTSEKQPDIHADWLVDSANQARLLVKLGWKLVPTSRVYTCCITSNRLFSGQRTLRTR